MQFLTMSKLLEKFLIYTEAKIDTMGRDGWRSARDRLTYYGKSIGASQRYSTYSLI